ncbi:MAG: hypothetical protein LBH32_12210 [Dysgonamonadaceae bacterium]|jgi:hypothetical protein|nr:hypothetical protein [Dysgonamonadaceae bacterium]
MSNNELNDAIVRTIIHNTPKSVKPVDYLSDILALSRESVYRRIRKEIPFTVEELAKASVEMGFSIDKVIGEVKSDRLYFDMQSGWEEASNLYINTFETYNNHLEKLIEAKKSDAQLILNHIPPLFSIYSDDFFKYSYFKWKNEGIDSCSVKYHFSDLEIPLELLELRKRIIYNIQRIKNSTLILSPNIFLDVIKEIQYHYHKRLITKDELERLKKSILDIISLSEIVAMNGGINPYVKTDIYLSRLYLSTNILYTQYEENIETHFWLYNTTPIIIRCSEICEIQRNWLRTVKMYSTLISLSNEILQTAFFDKQKEYANQYLTPNNNDNHFNIL